MKQKIKCNDCSHRRVCISFLEHCPLDDYELLNQCKHFTQVVKKTCDNCENYEPWTGACVNGESRYCADFVSSDNSCDKWEIFKGRHWNDEKGKEK